MKIIICIDNRNKYCFAHRRQSSDICQRKHMLTKIDKNDLVYNTYSARSLKADGIIEDDRPVEQFFLKEIKNDKWYFIENFDLRGYYHLVNEILLYIWDKPYPGDYEFPLAYFDDFSILETEMFAGHSHDVVFYRHLKKKEGAE